MPAARENPAEAPDATAEVRQTDALLKTGALQSAIFNSANFSSIATDAKGVIQIFNVGAERMLGYTAAEVVNTITAADLHDPQELIARAAALSVEFGTPIAPGFEALVFKAARGIEDIYELTKIRKDGSRFPAVVSVTALRDAQDAIIGYLLIGTDNTARHEVEEERKRLDQRLRDQQFYTRSLIESNIDALMTTDPRGIITDVNKQTEALTGCTRDELIGAPFKNCFTDPGRAEAGINRVLAEGKVTNYELTARARDGTHTVVSYNATTFHDRDRSLQGVFAAARDMTELKRFEHTLQQNEIQRERDAAHAKELAVVNQELEAFSYSVSHDLRAPLRHIHGYVEMLRGATEGQLSDKATHYLTTITDASVEMGELIDDLLAFSRVGRAEIRARRSTWTSWSRTSSAAWRWRSTAAHRLADRAAAAGRRRRVAAQAGAHQPHRQRGQVQPHARPGDDRDRLRRRRGRARRPVRAGQRRRVRHAVRAQAVRRVSAAAPGRGVRRHRHRPGDRPADRRPARRPRLGGGRAERGRHVLFHAGADRRSNKPRRAMKTYISSSRTVPRRGMILDALDRSSPTRSCTSGMAPRRWTTCIGVASSPAGPTVSPP